MPARSRVTVRRVALLPMAALLGCGGTVSIAPPSGVARTQRTWVDGSRTTPANGTYPGAPSRTLRVLLWQPASRGPLPLLVMAHGFGGLPDKFDAFAGSVAAAGFVVAAPAFPLTNADAPGGHTTTTALHDAVNEPADVSFVITRALQAAIDPSDPLHGRIDGGRIAVLGHSLGGAVAIGLTREACCNDPRLVAAILVDPLTIVSGLFGGPALAAGPPTLLLQGTADTTVSYASVVSFYGHIDPPRVLVGLEGGGHSDAVESQTEPPTPVRAAAQAATVAFLDAVFSGEEAALTNTLSALAAAGNPVQSDLGSGALARD